MDGSRSTANNPRAASISPAAAHVKTAILNVSRHFQPNFLVRHPGRQSGSENP
jgi:hypothetical protein